MRIAISFKDWLGNTHVDCSECQSGGNGNGACQKGGQFKLSNRGMCIKGKAFENLDVQKIEKKRSKHDKGNHVADDHHNKESDFWS